MVDDFARIKANISEWKTKKEAVGEYFRNRETSLAKEPMVMSTERFMESLLLLNHNGVEKEKINIEEIRQLERKPLNLEERLEFIIESPNHYHAYIQLKELFIELEKLVARYQVIEQRNEVTTNHSKE